MPRKQDDTPTLVTKKAAAKAAVKPAPRRKALTSAKAAPKPVGRPKATSKTVKAPLPKTAKREVAKPKTPSLVHAKPLSSISPTQPEQLLYESDIMREPIQPPKQPEKKSSWKTKVQEQPVVVADEPKRRPVGRPRGVKADPMPAEAPSAVAAPAPPAPVEVPKAHEAPTVSKTPRRHSHRRLFSRWSLVAMALALLAGGWFFMHRTPDVAAENNQLLAQISKVAVLPTDETPSISTVVDTTKVNQQFLKNAQKGDKVLLYFQSGRAIVYRPSTGQIVNMGPLETPKPRVFIRQGSSVNNVAAVRNVISKTSDFMLASQDQSANKTYTHTVVIDLTGNRPDLAGKLAQLLHVNVAQLPPGEDRPDADLMVIVGSDFKQP